MPKVIGVSRGAFADQGGLASWHVTLALGVVVGVVGLVLEARDYFTVVAGDDAMR